MKKPVEELSEIFDQILFWLRTNKKIWKPNKDAIIGIASKIINSESVTKDDIDFNKTFKKIEKEHWILPPFDYGLNHEYVLLSNWFLENNGFLIPEQNKIRFISISKRIEVLEEYTEEEVNEFDKKLSDE